MDVKIYHNPHCSKSRQTLQLLRQRGIEPEIIYYLKTPPTADELDNILKILVVEPRDLIRKQEATYKANGLHNPDLNRKTLINFMLSEPILIERPIVLANGKAAIGRPPENVLAIL